ncbi:transaldolase [Ammonifex degensii KC4]|uniref:Probable transaldolase n=1 Tax=Ammonifex degensii (strain DSM 10501 / KC4) TaxID=429009 RepID=C9R9G8_AMMDK|nr:fructose-6-phosphate aldolase [Ammonifex degensii]ACX52947.1 transaldolase [Ammonifex degensii KC4]
MKIFLDTAKVEEIRRAAEWGVVDGVTTNPSLLARAGRADVEAVVREIASLVDGPISVEVISTTAEDMVEEARRIASWGLNTAVKIPMTEEGLKAVKVLSREGIKTNVTLVFSVSQGLLAAKAGATFVSPFIGRLDDVSHEGMTLVRDLAHIFSRYGFSTEIIAASIRHPLHVVEAARAGAHVATVPFGVLAQMVKHPLTDVGIQRFLEDWNRLTAEALSAVGVSKA